MARLLGFLCFFTLVDPLFAKDKAVVFVVDPSWDCVASYAAHVPLLQEYKIIKVMTHLGEAAPCNSDHAEIYRNITYNSGVPNDVLAVEKMCPLLLSVGVPIAAVIATFDPAVALTDRLAACVGVRGNPVDGIQGSLARHDKWFVSGAVRSKNSYCTPAGRAAPLALRAGGSSLSGNQWPAIAGLETTMAIRAVAAVLALVASSRRDRRDGTEYLSIE